MADSEPFPKLLASAQQGDPEACDRLFARVADRLHLFAQLRLGAELRTRTESIDVMQEAFALLHRDLERFEAPGDEDAERTFVQWMCHVTENRIRDLAKHHRAERRSPDREQRDVTVVLRELQRSGCGPATRLVRQEERDRLADALASLKESDRDALVLRYFEGETIDRIAERTARSASAVRRSLGRATLKLGQLLKEASA